MIKRYVSEFLDENNLYVHIVSVTIFGIVIYYNEYNSSRSSIVNQFFNKEVKIGFKNETKD